MSGLPTEGSIKKGHKVPKRLSILVDPGLVGSPEFTRLAEQGHWITTTPVSQEGLPLNFYQFDRVVGPNCWRMTPSLLKYLPTLVKSARAEKYPKKKGEEDEREE